MSNNMSKLSNIVNVFCAIKGSTKVSNGSVGRVVPLYSGVATEIGTGYLVASTRRVLLGPSALALYAAFVRARCYIATDMAGARWMRSGSSPGYMAANRLVDGGLHVWHGKRAERKNALLALFASNGFPAHAMQDEDGQKDGCTYSFATPLTDAQADALVDMLLASAFTNAGAGNGCPSDARLGMPVDTASVTVAKPVDTVAGFATVTLEKSAEKIAAEGAKRAVKHTESKQARK